MTLEEWAPYGIGTPDAEGNYPDYRVPAAMRPEAPAAPSSAPGRFYWWADILPHWDAVLLDLMERGIDLYSPAVLQGSWLGVRGMILGLLGEPSRLARALKKETTK